MNYENINIDPFLGFEIITENDISNFEQEINHLLPDDYKDFLLQYNGGFPLYYYFNIEGTDKKIKINNGYGISSISGIDLKEIYLNAQKDYNLNDDLLPIADNGSGDFICLCLNKDKYGKLYMYFCSNPDDYYKYNIANSFEEFMNKLYK